MKLGNDKNPRVCLTKGTVLRKDALIHWKVFHSFI